MGDVAEIVARYRQQRKLSLACFGGALCEKLPGVRQSRQAVQNWEAGRQAPNRLFLLAVRASYEDWRREFAAECLALEKEGEKKN
jgi:transcriptional regulator with XRE-family HTH domain